jgi:putative transcriptional regulator
MAGHPNRGPKGPSANPAPEEVRAAREAAGLTQTQAAALVYGTLRAWQGWEAPQGQPDARRMHPGLWELFRIKTAA